MFLVVLVWYLKLDINNYMFALLVKMYGFMRVLPYYVMKSNSLNIL